MNSAISNSILISNLVLKTKFIIPSSLLKVKIFQASETNKTRNT